MHPNWWVFNRCRLCVNFCCVYVPLFSSEMSRRYSPRDKYATTATTAGAPPPKPPQPMRFTKLVQNGEGEKTVGKRRHTHFQSIIIFTAPTHTQYPPPPSLYTYVKQTYWAFESKHTGLLIIITVIMVDHDIRKHS